MFDYQKEKKKKESKELISLRDRYLTRISVYQGWIPFLEQRVNVKRGISKKDWDMEIPEIEELVHGMPIEQAATFQQLLAAEHYDYVGPGEVRLMGKAWSNKDSRIDKEFLPEPKGDQIREVTKELAQKIRHTSFLSRPKRDGIFFQGDGIDLCGTFRVRCPYKKAEFCDGVFYVFDTDAPERSQYQGWNFIKHSFSKEIVSSNEGIVVLLGGIEYKWKIIPTTEILVEKGIWQGRRVIGFPNEEITVVSEVYWSGEDPVYIRERFHKNLGSFDYWYIKSSLYFYMTEFGIADKVAHDLQDGNSWAYALQDGNYNIVYETGLDQEPFEEDQVVPIESVKATFKTASGDLAVIREKHKKWDLVGGTIEDGESPDQALDREISEEIGKSIRFLKKREIVFLNDRQVYRVHLYELFPTEETAQKFSSSSRKTLVPWFKHYEKATSKWLPLSYACGDFEDVLTTEKQIREYSFSPSYYVSLCGLLTEYPALKTTERVPCKEKGLYTRVASYIEVNGKRIVELMWSSIPTQAKILWILTHNMKDPPLPFGMTKKTFDEICLKVKKKCIVCDVHSLDQVCPGCIFRMTGN
jgi:ADP-ribose pyrophosphatase YjhB (NUDIX family)